MWRHKAIKWSWATLILNLTISLLNIWFGYSHLLKHEYWTMALSWAITIMNGGVALWTYTQIRKYRQELQAMMWQTLSTPSEALR